MFNLDEKKIEFVLGKRAIVIKDEKYVFRVQKNL